MRQQKSFQNGLLLYCLPSALQAYLRFCVMVPKNKCLVSVQMCQKFPACPDISLLVTFSLTFYKMGHRKIPKMIHLIFRANDAIPVRNERLVHLPNMPEGAMTILYDIFVIEMSIRN
jgi:hypothetical protein